MERLLYAIERFILTDVEYSLAQRSYAAAWIVRDQFGGRLEFGYLGGYDYHYWNIIGSALVDTSISLFDEAPSYRLLGTPDLPDEEELGRLLGYKRRINDFLDGHRNVGNGCG